MSYDKYIKYKSKYLQLKAKYTQVGGAGMWTISKKEGQKDTTPITQEESDALNKVISNKKGQKVIIKHGELRDMNGNKLINYKDGIPNEMNYKYVINANGINGTRESRNDIYNMLLVPDDTQGASAPTAPSSRSEYAPSSTPPPLPLPPSDIPTKFSNLLMITQNYNKDETLSNTILTAFHIQLQFMKINENFNIDDLSFYKVSNSQINMKYNNVTYPLSPTNNPTIWIYNYINKVVEV